MILLLLACDGKEPHLLDDTGSTRDTGETGADSGDDTGGDGSPACLPDDQRLVLGEWIHQLWLVAYAAPAAASVDTVLSFYQLPGVPAASWFLLDLAAPCTASHDLDPVCVEGVCYEVECTGEGGSWINHIENDADLPDDEITDYDGWIVDRGRLPLAWREGEPNLTLEIDVRALTAPDGSDWTVSGVGGLDGDLTLEVDFPALHPGGALHVSVAGGGGTVTVDGAVVATWDGTNLTDSACGAP